MECVPFESAPIEAYPSLDAWSAEAPGILARSLRRWNLTAGAPFVGGVAASVLAVRTHTGTPAVLKVGYPHAEAIWEAVGLGAFPEGSAALVLDQDAWTWALLLSTIWPGTPLGASDLDTSEALRLGGELHLRLTSAVAPARMPTLVEAMGDYARTARARLPEQGMQLDRFGVRGLVERAVDELEELAESGASLALLHGDFNPGNILLDNDGRWRVIDPKPLVGDPAYDLWPLVSQLGHPYEAANPRAVLAEQLSIAADAAEVDRTRAARWAFARTGLNVSWYLAEREPGRAEREASALIAWASVSGQ